MITEELIEELKKYPGKQVEIYNPHIGNWDSNLFIETNDTVRIR